MVLWLLSKGAGETPWSRAVEAGTQDVVKVFLDAGADVTQGAPLQMALLPGEKHANLELTRQLLELGAPVHKFVGEGSRIWAMVGFEQTTALQLACDDCHRNLAAVRLLLEYGANPTLNRIVRGVELPTLLLSTPP